MPDRLEALLANFSVNARAFHAGTLCGINPVQSDGVHGQLHLIRSGKVEVRHASGKPLRIAEPSLLLYPRPLAHRFVTSKQQGAEFACAHLTFEGGAANPIASALPAQVCLPLRELQGGEAALELLFAEAAMHYCGRQAMLDRLFEVVLIHVLRQLMERGETRAGMLAGLGHQRLRLALVAMHETPAHEWTLDTLASTAGMSRSVFANSFRDIVGCTPGAYLSRWRIGLAQKALLQDRSIKLIAQEVGYGSEAALSRAFKAQAGKSPREWRNSQAQSP
jgi:AraC-like DNA-binding protein